MSIVWLIGLLKVVPYQFIGWKVEKLFISLMGTHEFIQRDPE
jgi:hypothetical protein